MPVAGAGGGGAAARLDLCVGRGLPGSNAGVQAPGDACLPAGEPAGHRAALRPALRSSPPLTRSTPCSSPLVPPAAMEEERAAFTALSSLQKGEEKVGPRAVAFVFQKFPLDLAFKGRPPRLPAGRWRHWPGLGCPPLLSVPRAALLSCF